LEIGTNDLSNLSPEVVGSRIYRRSRTLYAWRVKHKGHCCVPSYK
jgi:hypothetical protein